MKPTQIPAPTALLAAGCLFAALPAAAEPFSFPAPTDNSFIATYQISSDPLCGGECDFVSSPSHSLVKPAATYGTVSFVSSEGSVSPTEMKALMSAGGGPGVEMNMGVRDTYTVHGTAGGPFDLTVSLHAAGAALSEHLFGSTSAFIAGQVVLNIGAFDTNPADVLPSVIPFAPSARVQQGLPVVVEGTPFSIPIDLTDTYTLTGLHVGDTFDLAYGLDADTGGGGIDLSHTATIGFDLPSGVFLTSAGGGTFGTPIIPTPEPATLSLLAGGLLAMGCLRRRPRKG